VVISSFQKDYELQSWNEQGEITEIEGMLTIAFSFIFPCSHIDGRKELYLIIKILYMVYMPRDYEELLKSKLENNKDRLELFDKLVPSLLKEFEKEKSQRIMLENKIRNFEAKIQKSDLKDMDFGLGEGLPPVNLDKYAEWVVEIPKLKERVKELEKNLDEMNEIKKENLRLKIISGEAKSGWKKDRDMIERDNPITGKVEHYKCPIRFEHHRVRNLKYLDDRRLKVEFYHDGKWPYDQGYYPMATDAYLWLCGRLPEQKKEKLESKKMDIHSINSVQEMNKFIKSIDKDAKLHRKFFHQTANYLLRNRDSRIKFADYKKYVKFSGRQIGYDWLNDFQRWGFVKKVPNKKGYWDVIF